MIYFYMWVLFLVSIVSALPIVAYVEKSRLQKARETTPEPSSEAADVAFDDEPVKEVVADDGMGEFGAKTADPDDFSAFDDFK